jgi:hypothetical protein
MQSYKKYFPNGGCFFICLLSLHAVALGAASVMPNAAPLDLNFGKITCFELSQIWKAKLIHEKEGIKVRALSPSQHYPESTSIEARCAKPDSPAYSLNISLKHGTDSLERTKEILSKKYLPITAPEFINYIIDMRLFGAAYAAFETYIILARSPSSIQVIYIDKLFFEKEVEIKKMKKTETEELDKRRN